MVKLCKQCHDEGNCEIITPVYPICLYGYYSDLIEECMECPSEKCIHRKPDGDYTFVDVDIPDEDFELIVKTFEGKKFIDMMVNLRKSNPTEYQLKMKNIADTILEDEDFDVLEEISDDISFFKSMIELKQENIIEYELKMSQFRNQVEQKKQIEGYQNLEVPHCPTCGSSNVKKISGLSKAGSVALWGIFSRKVHKQWHCYSCGSEW